jgi:hypothetical protein
MKVAKAAKRAHRAPAAFNRVRKGAQISGGVALETHWNLIWGNLTASAVGEEFGFGEFARGFVPIINMGNEWLQAFDACN